LRTRIGTINGVERFGSGGLAANQGKYHPKPSQSLPGATMELLSFQKSGVIWVISVVNTYKCGIVLENGEFQRFWKLESVSRLPSSTAPNPPTSITKNNLSEYESKTVFRQISDILRIAYNQ